MRTVIASLALVLAALPGLAQAQGTSLILWLPDGQAEAILDDTDEDGSLDAFEIKAGSSGQLVAFYFNEDDIMDLVVDVNGNSFVDRGEPTLEMDAAGGIARVAIMIDINGDGGADLVEDTCMTGEVASFTPAAKENGKWGIRPLTESIQLVVGQGDADPAAEWLFASKGQDLDAFYDPETGESNYIGASRPPPNPEEPCIAPGELAQPPPVEPGQIPSDEQASLPPNKTTPSPDDEPGRLPEAGSGRDAGAAVPLAALAVACAAGMARRGQRQ